MEVGYKSPNWANAAVSMWGHSCPQVRPAVLNLKSDKRRPHQECNIVPFALGQVERLSEPSRFLSHTQPQKTCLLLLVQGHHWELRPVSENKHSDHAVINHEKKIPSTKSYVIHNHETGRFYARDVKVVKTHLMSETLKPSGIKTGQTN